MYKKTQDTSNKIKNEIFQILMVEFRFPSEIAPFGGNKDLGPAKIGVWQSFKEYILIYNNGKQPKGYPARFHSLHGLKTFWQGGWEAPPKSEKFVLTKIFLGVFEQI